MSMKSESTKSEASPETAELSQRRHTRIFATRCAAGQLRRLTPEERRRSFNSRSRSSRPRKHLTAFLTTCSTSSIPFRDTPINGPHRPSAHFSITLRKSRHAAVNRPRETSAGRTGRHVPASVTRAVWQRDQGQCAFVGTVGRRAAVNSLSVVTRPFKRPFQLGCRLESVGWILGQACSNQTADLRWKRRDGTRARPRLRSHPTARGEMSGDHLVQHETERKDVTPCADVAPP